MGVGLSSLGQGKPYLLSQQWLGHYLATHTHNTRARKYNWFQIGEKNPAWREPCGIQSGLGFVLRQESADGIS